MCGIAGIVKKKEAASAAEIRAMCDELARRGPDAEGAFLEANRALGHRRLSVIDLTTGDQPMHSEDGAIVVVFNGEIYNYLALRGELAGRGYAFRTTSDTEVLINGFRAHGIEGLLRRIEGMFAFALLDRATGQLYIARDRFGEKPLYYCETDCEFVFASELKALTRHVGKPGIDSVGLNFFLTLTYIPAPHTIYRGMRKLRAGHYLKVDEQGRAVVHRYYDLRKRLDQLPVYTDFEEAREDVRRLVTESIRERMVADVPLGVFLSGGMDSSIVAAVMGRLSDKQIQTFSLGFTEKAYDETERAMLVAEHIGSRHTTHTLEYRDVAGMLDEVILYFDEPFGDSSAIPSHYVAKLAREHVTVALSGDCADELFGGYEKYLGRYYVEQFRRAPRFAQQLAQRLIGAARHSRLTDPILRRLKKVVENAHLGEFDLHYCLMCLGFGDLDRAALLENDWFADVKPEIEGVYRSQRGASALGRGQFTDVHVALEGDMLAKVDRACMKNSLEARVPFLATALVEAAFRMPDEFKIAGRSRKRVLKEAFRDLLPPKTLRMSKKGFGVPVSYWFKHELRGELELLLDPERLRRQGIFRAGKVRSLLDEHLQGKQEHKSKLWNLYVFQKWHSANLS
jgi:asparagine synthase (glutamine-hydrolysing)